jgi:phage-related protein
MLIDKSAEMGKGEIVNAKGQITDMEGLNAALIALMEERYEGGMETASKSFKGMVSNVQDSVGTITRELGKPIFETFKSGLKAIVPVASAVTSFVKGDMTGGVKTLTDAFGEEKTASIMGFFNKLSTGFQTAKTWVLSFAPTISNLGTVFSNLMPVITSVGSIIAGAFLGIASVLPPIFNYITDIAVKITEWGGFVPILSGIVAGFAAFKVIGTLVNVFNNVKTAITAVRTAMLLFNASLLANPIGIIVALLVGLGTAFVVAYQKSEIFRNIVNGVWEAIKGAWSATVSFFTESIPKWVSDVVGYFQNLKDKAVEKWSSFKDSTVNIFNSVKEFFTNTWNNIKSSVTSVITGFVSTITSKWNSFKSTTLSVFNTIKSTLTTIWNTIKSVVSNVVGGIFSTAKSKFDSLKSTVSSIFNSIKSTATSVWNGVKSAITNPIESAKNTISKIIEKIKGFFSGLKLSFPKISMPKLPHFKLTGSFSLKPPSVPKLSVSWYKDGGLFNQASIIGVGEEPGVSEAVLPLKDSVLGKIGAMIANTMNMDRLLTRIDQLVNLTNPNMLMGAFGGGMSQQFIRNLDLVPSTTNNQEIVLHNTFNFNTTGGISDKDMKKASDYFANGMINKIKLTGKI